VAGENTRPCAVLRQVASERMRRRGTIATNGGIEDNKNPACAGSWYAL